MKLLTLVTFTLSFFSTSLFAKTSTEQMLQLGEYVNGKVDSVTLKEVNKIGQCGGISKFFDRNLSNGLMESGLDKLVSSSDLDEETAWNYLLLGSMYFVNMAIEKGYIDQDNPENDHTINATKQLYGQMCSDLKIKKKELLNTKQELTKPVKSEIAKKRSDEIKKNNELKAEKLKLEKEASSKKKKNYEDKQKQKAQELASLYREDAKRCVLGDGERVKSQLSNRLPKIHRPDSIQIEDLKISKMKFLTDPAVMEISYTFKLYTQTKYKNSWGSKSETNALKSTGDIKVKPYARSSAVAKCTLNGT
ncbi:hypothetical protein ACTXIM_01980 [Pseudoalteromonas nigrifaciens]|uniref:hypothetical protein n=1 Tax=Pseudoalteromonas nigrifaciens TaxID=28109 RepID=UPI001787B680|nr:hypothetical protein [Pseudoalteromonas nigrifaciens]MBE0419220.1 hypothetical protein [Pseudoalteromonas nigrifaciens]